MNRRRAGKAVSLVAVSVLAMVAGPFVAYLEADQKTDSIRPWTATAWAQGAYQIPSGRLATAPSNLIEIPLANTVANLGRSFVASGGISVGFPAHDLDVRLGVETSIGAEATGQVGICDLVEGLLCQPETASVVVRGIMAELRTYRGDPEWPVRPMLGGGAGWRQYSFNLPDCTDRSSGDPRRVCELISDLFRGDGGGHVVFRFAAGARARSGRYVSDLVASLGAGRYGGGAQRVNGNWYLDIRIELSAGVQIL